MGGTVLCAESGKIERCAIHCCAEIREKLSSGP